MASREVNLYVGVAWWLMPLLRTLSFVAGDLWLPHSALSGLVRHGTRLRKGPGGEWYKLKKRRR